MSSLAHGPPEPSFNDRLPLKSQVQPEVSSLGGWVELAQLDIPDTEAASIVSRIIMPQLNRYSLIRPRPGDVQESRMDRDPQMARIDLIIYLLRTRNSFEPDFWATIVKWQIAQYKLQSWKLLQDYKAAMQNNIFDRGNKEVIVCALEKAVQRVNALEAPEKATFKDAFVIRNIYDDPDLKAVIASRFSPEQQLRLSKAMDEILLQQPAFPPQCFSLLGSGATYRAAAREDD